MVKVVTLCHSHVTCNDVSSDLTHRIISVREAIGRSDFNQITTLVDKHQ